MNLLVDSIRNHMSERKRATGTEKDVGEEKRGRCNEHAECVRGYEPALYNPAPINGMPDLVVSG